MPFEDLDILIEHLGYDDPSHEDIFQLYGVFINDFVKNPLILTGRIVKINTNLSRHPLFRNKYETFVHIVTRKSMYSDKRQFDRDRANRIHWIRPVLENANPEDVLYFEKVNEDGYNQYYYWYAEKDFMVILRELEPDLLLLTSFCVDNLQNRQYRKWYQEYVA